MTLLLADELEKLGINDGAKGDLLSSLLERSISFIYSFYFIELQLVTLGEFLEKGKHTFYQYRDKIAYMFIVTCRSGFATLCHLDGQCLFKPSDAVL